jgi:signal transduction histidine kinase
LNHKKPTIINDVQIYFKDKGLSEHVPSFKSFLGIQLTSKDELVGILALVNRDNGYNELFLEWFEPLFSLAGRIVNEVRLVRFQQEVKEQYIEKEKAEAKSEAKSAFLAHMSHELRTPLGGLIGLLELINKEQMSTTDLDYLQMAKDTSSSLLDILNDILDLSKIEENKLTLETTLFNPITVALFGRVGKTLKKSRPVF